MYKNQHIRPLYEAHHNIELPDAVLKAAVDYSVQYIPQRSLPDKAIDLIDVTAAHLASQHPVTDIKTLEADIADAKAKQEEYAQKEDYESAHSKVTSRARQSHRKSKGGSASKRRSRSR